MITQEQELTHFIQIWRQKPLGYRAQIIEEVSSYHQESNKTPDHYFFDFDADGDLYSQTSGKKVRDGVRRDSYTDKIEGEIVDVINREIKKGYTRFAWISPPCHQVYPGLKIIVSEVVQYQGKRRFLNRSFLFDFDYNQSWDFARAIVQISINNPQLTTLEDIRRLPLILDPKRDWVARLAKAAKDPNLEWFIKSGEDRLSKQQALTQASTFVELMVSKEDIDVNSYGFGDHISSCPPSLADLSGISTQIPSWCEYDMLTSEYRCKFCRKGLSLFQIKKHRCVC